MLVTLNAALTLNANRIKNIVLVDALWDYFLFRLRSKLAQRSKLPTLTVKSPFTVLTSRFRGNVQYFFIEI